MKVRMFVSIAGDRWSARPGEVVELDPLEADRFVAAGIAAAVVEEPATVATGARLVADAEPVAGDSTSAAEELDVTTHSDADPRLEELVKSQPADAPKTAGKRGGGKRGGK